MFQLNFLTRRHFGVQNRAPWRKIVMHCVHEFHDNDLFTSAAAMSYFGLLSLFPTLLLLLTLGNWIAASSDILSNMVESFPGSAEFLRATVRSLSHVGTGVIVSCFVVMLWAGSWVFAVVERALNRIWNTTPRRFLHGRALTIGMIGLIGLLLSTSLLLTSILVWVGKVLTSLSPRQVARWSTLAVIGGLFGQMTFAAASVLLTITVFLLVYRFMPNTRVSFRDALPGAIVGGLSWEAGKYLFASSLQYFHYDQIYGSVGAVVSVLTWSYVSSLILLFGAQLTAVTHREHPTKSISHEARFTRDEIHSSDPAGGTAPQNVIELKSSRGNR